ncbi:TlpA family protein disulfide reductase [Sporosarcina sp. BI001-red]|uniref:peroxiredoxin family protein n=1 Tax=Sporosarcina sp. BI001-red TaxID=2282866 RepID=UPI000E220BF3|nr:redoxin domain-containing protein [Sporosarcina sp. BI001-red]REB05219.1 TlpA family protein disulfide reductase [Sporosarcina sp. BI001-red]
MKPKSIIGTTVSVLIIAIMLIILVKNKFVAEEYPSGMIEDQPNKLLDTEYELSSSDLNIGIENNQLAPDFELQNLYGEKIRLSDYRGKKVFLNFWASWCGPCKVEMPYMENYYKKHKDLENAEIIAVNMTKSEFNTKKVQEFVDAHGLTFPVLLDNNGDIERIYKVIGFPTTYLINEDGIIVHGFTGAVKNANEVEKLINKIK